VHVCIQGRLWVKIPQVNFLLFKNLDCRKIGPNSMQPPSNSSRKYFLASPWSSTFMHTQNLTSYWKCNCLFVWLKVIPNSCATHALLSVLLNCENKIKLGDILTRLKHFTRSMNPEVTYVIIIECINRKWRMLSWEMWMIYKMSFFPLNL